MKIPCEDCISFAICVNSKALKCDWLGSMISGMTDGEKKDFFEEVLKILPDAESITWPSTARYDPTRPLKTVIPFKSYIDGRSGYIIQKKEEK